MGIVAVVYVDTAEGKTAEALQAIKQIQKHCLALDTCDSFDILQSNQNENQLILVEQWKSPEDHDAVLLSLMQSSQFNENSELFVYGPDVEYFQLK